MAALRKGSHRKAPKQQKENTMANFTEELPPVEPNQPKSTVESEWTADSVEELLDETHKVTEETNFVDRYGIPAQDTEKELAGVDEDKPLKVTKPKPPMLSDAEFNWDF